MQPVTQNNSFSFTKLMPGAKPWTKRVTVAQHQRFVRKQEKQMEHWRKRSPSPAATAALLALKSSNTGTASSTGQGSAKSTSAKCNGVPACLSKTAASPPSAASVIPVRRLKPARAVGSNNSGGSSSSRSRDSGKRGTAHHTSKTQHGGGVRGRGARVKHHASDQLSKAHLPPLPPRKVCHRLYSIDLSHVGQNPSQHILRSIICRHPTHLLEIVPSSAFTIRNATVPVGLANINWTGRSAANFVENYTRIPFALHQTRTNHFPGVNYFCSKMFVQQQLDFYARLFPNEYNFVPQTWKLPGDARALEEAMKKSNAGPAARRNGMETFILKPGRGSQGHGIMLVQTWDSLCKHLRVLHSAPKVGTFGSSGSLYSSHSSSEFREVRKADSPNVDFGHVVQRYISDPLLLGGKKFDFRVYVLLESLAPLKIHVFRDGLARFATQQYKNPKSGNLGDSFRHLTNFSLNFDNKHSFVEPTIVGLDGAHIPVCSDDNPEGWRYGQPFKSFDDQTASKRTMSTTMAQLQKAYPDFDEGSFWNQAHEVICKVLAALWGPCWGQFRQAFPDATETTGWSPCFHLLGFDVMLDASFKVWFVELNTAPSLDVSSPVDQVIKESVVEGALALLGYLSAGELKPLSYSMCAGSSVVRSATNLKNPWFSRASLVPGYDSLFCENTAGGRDLLLCKSPQLRTMFERFISSSRSGYILSSSGFVRLCRHYRLFSRASGRQRASILFRSLLSGAADTAANVTGRAGVVRLGVSFMTYSVFVRAMAAIAEERYAIAAGTFTPDCAQRATEPTDQSVLVLSERKLPPGRTLREALKRLISLCCRHNSEPEKWDGIVPSKSSRDIAREQQDEHSRGFRASESLPEDALRVRFSPRQAPFPTQIVVDSGEKRGIALRPSFGDSMAAAAAAIVAATSPRGKGVISQSTQYSSGQDILLNGLEDDHAGNRKTRVRPLAVSAASFQPTVSQRLIRQTPRHPTRTKGEFVPLLPAEVPSSGENTPVPGTPRNMLQERKSRRLSLPCARKSKDAWLRDLLASAKTSLLLRGSPTDAERYRTKGCHVEPASPGNESGTNSFNRASSKHGGGGGETKASQEYTGAAVAKKVSKRSAGMAQNRVEDAPPKPTVVYSIPVKRCGEVGKS